MSNSNKALIKGKGKSSPNGGNKNVTQEQERKQPGRGKGDKRRNKDASRGDSARGSSGKQSNLNLSPKPEPSNSRTSRSRSSTPGKSDLVGSGTRTAKDSGRKGSDVSSTKNSCGRSTGNSQAKPSGLISGSRQSNSFDKRVWTERYADTIVRGRRRPEGGRDVQVTPDKQEVFFVKTYRLLFDDLAPHLTPFFDEARQRRGVNGMISHFSDLSYAIINSSEVSLADQEFVSQLRELGIKPALQLLRFGKRYTPTNMSEAQKLQTIKKFRDRNNRIKQLDDHPFPGWFVDLLQDIGKSLFSAAGVTTNADFDSLVGDRSIFTDLSHLPSGATAEGLHNGFEKWLYVKAEYGELDMLSGYVRHIGVNDELADIPSVLVTVPKDYRGPRVIMEEPLERTLEQSLVADALLRVISTETDSPYCPAGLITLDDQTRNQDLARCGSRYKYHVTADLSDASDSISYKLIRAAFPWPVARRILRGCSKRVLLPTGETIPLYMPCTMGSRVTVPAQSLTYWVLMCAAVRIGVLFGVCTLDAIKDCSSYNDDLIMPLAVWEIFCWLAKTAGLLVNNDKSYADDHPFRESCGVDCYDGSDVSTLYWPRRELSMRTDDLPSFCSLQNKLFALGAMKAARHVEQFVKAICPKVPVTLSDETTTSLWGYKSSRTMVPYEVEGNTLTEIPIWYCILPERSAVRRRMVVFTHEPSGLDGFVEYATWVPVVESATVTMPRDIADIARGCHVPRVIFGDRIARYDTNVVYTVNELSRNPWPLRKVKDHHLCDGYFSLTDTVVRETYDNRRIQAPYFIDRTIISNQILNDLVELYEYESWLLHGSQYPDLLCRSLGVTMPSRRAKRLVPKGFTTVTVKYTGASPDVLLRGDEQRRQRVALAMELDRIHRQELFENRK